ncbi:MAG: NADPH:quinone oxidoreductase family protein [Povalibacter sp.]
MKAVVVHSFDPPRIEVEEVSNSSVPSGHVRVRVHAVGCGFPDALMMAGKYQVKAELPFTPGTEIAGVVSETAGDVSDIQLGSSVFATVSNGGMAEECIVPAKALISIPEHMSMTQAAGFLVNYGTTYHALVQRARLQNNEALLVVGASGGTGIAAIELGKALGARVLAGVGSDAKMEIATKHGAYAAFNYSERSVKDAVADFTQGRGIDVVYDPVGSALAEQCVRSMGWNGRYLVIGFAGGSIPSIPMNLPLLKGCSIIGVFWGAHTRREPAVHAENLAALLRLFDEGKLNPEIMELEGLGSIHEALTLLQERRAVGKIVMRVDGSNH